MPVRGWGHRAAGLLLTVAGAAAAPQTTGAAAGAELPPAPRVGVAETGPGGAVRIPVEASAGTTVEVRAGRRVVAAAYSGGGVQWLAFTARTGAHRYTVRVADGAGAVSRPVGVTVRADGTPPAVRKLRVRPGTAADARTRVSFFTDPGTTYTVTIDGLPVADGTTSDGAVRLPVLLHDGPHVLSVGLVDPAGNRRSADRRFEVAVPRLRVTAEQSSAPDQAVQVVAVRGTPGAVATVTVPDTGSRRVRLTGGAGRVRFDLPDGSYPAVRVRLVDRAGRRGSTRLEPFTVDTAAPRLAVEDLGVQESWTARVAAEPGSLVTWRLRGSAGEAVADGSWTAGPGPRRAAATGLGEGDYQLTVTATDAAGNTTTRVLATTVAASLGAGEVATGAGSALLLVIGLGLLSLVVSAQRERVTTRREREALRAAAEADLHRREEAARRHAEAVAAYQHRLVDFEAATLLHERDLAAWEQRRTHLADLLQRARLDRGIRPTGFTTFKLRAWEQLYCTVPGSMVEVRRRQGGSQVTVVDDGEVTVTSDRVVFTGFKRREWSLVHLEAMEHMGTDRTMMKVSTRKTWSGVTYADPAHTRLCIALAASDRAGSRDDVVAAAERALVAHEQVRPAPPEHPGPPPTSPDDAAGDGGSPISSPPEAPVGLPAADHSPESRIDVGERTTCAGAGGSPPD